MFEAISEDLQKIAVEMDELLKRKKALLESVVGEEVEDYSLLDSSGNDVRLSSLFGEKDDLILIHNMGRGCTYCTLWADGLNGVTDHLQSRAALALVSPNPPAMQKEFSESRGWTFPMYSASESRFTHDMGFAVEDENGNVSYWPGVSTFHRNEDGSIRRVGVDIFGPGDVYAGIWHLFDLLPGGADDWQPAYSYVDGSRFRYGKPEERNETTSTLAENPA